MKILPNLNNYKINSINLNITNIWKIKNKANNHKTPTNLFLYIICAFHIFFTKFRLIKFRHIHHVCKKKKNRNTHSSLFFLKKISLRCYYSFFSSINFKTKKDGRWESGEVAKIELTKNVIFFHRNKCYSVSLFSYVDFLQLLCFYDRSF